MRMVPVLAFIAALSFTGAGLRTRAPGSAEKPSEQTATDQGSAAGARRPSTEGFAGGCTGFDSPRASTPASPGGELQNAGASTLKNFLGAGEANVPPGVRLAVALVPDPLHTNLSLLFDREMVALQQAAQDDGYVYDSSWIPWWVQATSSSPGGNKPPAGQVRARQACPGIAMFRRNVSTGTDSYRDGLIVLIVGEQPTGGINQDQWTNAIHWLALHAAERGSEGNAPALLRLIGPTFSGSLPSLMRDLDGLYGTNAPGDADAVQLRKTFPAVRILSGNVRNCSSVQWFEEGIKRFGGKILFSTLQENDAVLIDRFLRYLKSQDTEGRDVAIISEDETAYATPSASERANLCGFQYAPRDRPLRLSYPRDISALRTAYDKQSIFGASSSAQHTARRILQQSDDDLPDASPNNGDSIPTFSGDMTPVAEEAVLYGVVSYLRTHHTRYLLLRCSNQLDFLFLTRFFHQAYPEGRIVTVGSDLLFRREVDSTEFRGVMALSTYPLLPRNQHWSALYSQASERTPSHTHRVFEDHNQEGEYIGARYLFGRNSVDLMRSEVLPFQTDIPDSAEPYWLSDSIYPGDRTHAPTWISVVGRDGYWPIAVLDEKSAPRVQLGAGDVNETSGPGSQLPKRTLAEIESGGKHYENEPAHPDQRSHTLSFGPALSWRIVTLGAISLLAYQAIAVVWGTKLAGHRLLWSFRRIPSTSQATLIGVNCALAAMLALSPLSMLQVSPVLMFHDAGILIIATLGIAVLVVLSACLFRYCSRAAFLGFAGVLVAFASISLVALHSSLNDANRVPLTIRITQLTSGASPLLPVLFLFAGFYLWSWHTMAGNSLLCCGRPLLPRFKQTEATGATQQTKGGDLQAEVERDDTALHGTQFRISEAIGGRIVKAASPFTVPMPVLIPCVSLLLIILLCYHRDLPLLTMESHAFAFCINLGLLAACLLTCAEAARLLLTWSEMKVLLASLDQTRLRRTFSRLRAVDTKSLWSVSGNVSRVQSHFFREQLDAAERLLQQSTTPLTRLKSAVHCGHEFFELNAARIQSGSRWEEPIRCSDVPGGLTVRELCSEAVAEAFNRVLIPAWKSEKASLNFGGSASPGGDGPSATMPLSDDAAVRTAEEFVCFHYIAFIQNVLARMRSMALSMATLFVAVCLAISFYPFVPRTEIGIWMLANLFVIGGSVLYVYAAMERDATLSHIASSEPGRLGPSFWLKSASFLAAPILGVVTTQFPSIADSVLAWVQPGLDAISR